MYHSIVRLQNPNIKYFKEKNKAGYNNKSNLNSKVREFVKYQKSKINLFVSHARIVMSVFALRGKSRFCLLKNLDFVLKRTLSTFVSFD